MKFEFTIDNDVIKKEFFEDTVKTDITEKMYDDAIQMIYYKVSLDIVTEIMDTINSHISKHICILRQEIENQISNEITISKDLLKYLMVTAAHNDLNGPTKEAYDMYDIDQGIELIPKLEDSIKQDFSKSRSDGTSIDVLCKPNYGLDIDEKFHKKIK